MKTGVSTGVNRASNSANGNSPARPVTSASANARIIALNSLQAIFMCPLNSEY